MNEEALAHWGAVAPKTNKRDGSKLVEIDIHYYRNIQFSLRDCSIHIPTAYQILFTYIFYVFFNLYYLCYFMIEFTFYISHHNMLQ